MATATSGAASTGIRTTSCRCRPSPSTPGGVGYWLLDPDGFNYDFANPPDPDPSPPGLGHRGHGGRPGAPPTPTPATSAIPTAPARSGVRCSPPGCGSRPGCPSRPTRSPGTSTTGPPPTPGCCPPTRPSSAGRRRALRHGPRGRRPRSVHVGHRRAGVAGRRRRHRRGRRRPRRHRAPGRRHQRSLPAVRLGRRTTGSRSTPSPCPEPAAVRSASSESSTRRR